MVVAISQTLQRAQLELVYFNSLLGRTAELQRRRDIAYLTTVVEWYEQTSVDLPVDKAVHQAMHTLVTGWVACLQGGATLQECFADFRLVYEQLTQVEAGLQERAHPDTW
jgi:hypothetical protein